MHVDRTSRSNQPRLCSSAFQSAFIAAFLHNEPIFPVAFFFFYKECLSLPLFLFISFSLSATIEYEDRTFSISWHSGAYLISCRVLFGGT